MSQAVWKAFFEFENSMIVWKDVEMIPRIHKESREESSARPGALRRRNQETFSECSWCNWTAAKMHLYEVPLAMNRRG